MRPSIESARIASPCVLDDVAGRARRRSPARSGRGSGPSLPRRAPAGRRRGHAHRLRALLRQRLRGQDVLDLARADAECQRAEGAVRGGVRIAAHDRHARLRQARAPARSRARCPGARARVRSTGSPNSATFAAERIELRLRERDRCSGATAPRSARCGRPWPACGRRAARARPAARRPSKACGLETSCTRCRSMNSRSSPIAWSSQIFSAIVRAVICESLPDDTRGESR